MIQIDSQLIREKFAGTYIVQDNSEVALIEVSTANAVNKILNKLLTNSITPNQVKYIFITHIHLDHASGAGALLQHLPNAKVVLHPSGKKHMINPEKLIQGANAVYGEEIVKRDYGTILPIDEDRVIECCDGETFLVGNRELTTIFTPGHARHHISIYDKETEGIFTGDSFGLSYPEMTVENRRFYQPTTTPTAFEYDKMITSIKKMMSYKPKKIYFTHFGETNEPKEVEKQVVKRLKDYKELVFEAQNDEDMIISLEKRLSDYYLIEAQKHGSKLTDNQLLKLFSIDIKLNAMGLALWFKRI